jgi:hypothetical protein
MVLHPRPEQAQPGIVRRHLVLAVGAKNRACLTVHCHASIGLGPVIQRPVFPDAMP